MTEPLPKFDLPPVVETVMGVYFRPQPRLTNPVLTRFWLEKLSVDFPGVEERAYLESPVVRFGPDLLTPARSLSVRWAAHEREPTRLWLQNESGNHILQLQRSALLANWLRDATQQYVDFAERKASYDQILQELIAFVDHSGFDPLTPKLAMVRYINHVPLEQLDGLPEAYQSTLCGWSNDTSDDWLPAADQLTFNLGYPFPESHGRLDVVVSPAKQLSDEQFRIRIDLTAIINLADMSGQDDWNVALQAIDQAHEWVVRGFASLTTPTMHQQWKRQV